MALYCLPDYQTNFKSFGLLVQEKKFNIDFQDGGHLKHAQRKASAMTSPTELSSSFISSFDYVVYRQY